VSIAGSSKQANGSGQEQTIHFGPDPFILAVVLLILAVGCVTVTSASYMIAFGKTGDGFYFAKKQAIAMLFGLALMYLFSRVNPDFWKRAAIPIMGCSMALLLLVFVPGVGVEMGGSSRWIRLPFGFFVQPSELVKFALIIFIARSLAKKGDSIREFAIGFLPHIIVMGIVVFFILMQPDFGTAVILTMVVFLMLFIAGVRVQHLAGSLLLCVPFLIHMAFSAEYRVARLRTFLDPWSSSLKSGFQIIQSLVAFGCGGFWGVGVGNGLQKLYYLPQPHSDFIFAVVGEEFGFIGVFCLIILFYLFICRGLTIAMRTGDAFQRYLAFGITCLIGLQAMVNMGVAMGLLPTKGLPLPLVSLGGTSLVMTLAGVGILMAIIKSTQAKLKETIQ
jgi:cell division protein FtsW